MSAQRKHVGKGQSASLKKNSPQPRSPAASPRRESSALVSAQKILDECIGASCLVEVTLHSLEFQEIATPEQEVLKRALNAIWCVHDLINERKIDRVIGGRATREDES